MSVVTKSEAQNVQQAGEKVKYDAAL